MPNTNVFISFSSSDIEEKERLVEKLQNSSYAVNYSEDEDRSHLSDATIWKNLKNRIAGSSVMIVLYNEDFQKGLGGKACKVKDSNDIFKTKFQNQGWIYKELRCALKDGENNNINGILVVMPDEIYKRKYTSGTCSKSGTATNNFDFYSYPEILKNNYINKKDAYRTPECGCCYSILKDSYIPIVKQSAFESDMKYYIELVKEKRNYVNEYNIRKETDA